MFSLDRAWEARNKGTNVLPRAPEGFLKLLYSPPMCTTGNEPSGWPGRLRNKQLIRLRGDPSANRTINLAQTGYSLAELIVR